MWGCLAATDPNVTAVHLCHQAYMGLGCGFSEQLQMLIPAGLLQPLLLSPSPLFWVPHFCPSVGVPSRWDDAAHDAFSGSNAYVESWQPSAGSGCPVPQFPHRRGGVSQPCR